MDNIENYLQEEASYNISSAISESTDGGPKKYFLRGEFSRSDVPNKNGRIYSKQVLKDSINENASTISSRQMMGELDHPPTPRINIKEVSHLVTKLDLDESGCMTGEIEVLDTPNGNILKKLIESGVKLGVSSRGYGKVIKKGELLEVAPGYKMITFDIVADPSSQQAFPNPVLENTETPTTKVKDIFKDIF